MTPHTIFGLSYNFLSIPKLGLTRYFSTTLPSLNRSPNTRWERLSRIHSLDSEEDHASARSWLDGFKESDIPKEAWEAGYSRSSGPGGQHVNKTNSKATVRCDLVKASQGWLPPFLLSPLSKSSHYIPSPPSLLISSQQSRTSSSNLSSALTILHQTIVSAGKSVIVGETSAEQKKKVQGLERMERGRKRAEKERRSAKKSGRKDMG